MTAEQFSELEKTKDLPVQESGIVDGKKPINKSEDSLLVKEKIRELKEVDASPTRKEKITNQIDALRRNIKSIFSGEYALSPREKAFKESPFVGVIKLEAGSTGGINLARLETGEYGIFKSYSNLGEQAKKYINRERAAYLVSEIGFNRVPLTVLREGRVNNSLIKGSFQQLVEDASTLAESDTELVEKDELIRMNVFDFILYNQDRKGGNALVISENNKLAYIDHGQTFIEGMAKDAGGHFNFLSPDIREEMIPQDIIDFLRDFSTNPEAMPGLIAQLDPLLGSENSKLYARRIQAFYESIQSDKRFNIERFKELIALAS